MAPEPMRANQQPAMALRFTRRFIALGLVALWIGFGVARGQDSVVDPEAAVPDPSVPAATIPDVEVPTAGNPPANEVEAEPPAASTPADTANNEELAKPDQEKPEQGNEVAKVRFGPDTYLVRDKSGQLQPVLNLTYQQLVELLEGQATADGPAEASSAAEASYSLDSLEMTGSLQTDYIELECRYTIKFESDGEVGVPLGFLGAPLQRAPNLPAQVQRVQYSRSTGGYVAACRAKSGQSCVLSLNVLVPVQRVENGERLMTNIPRALGSRLVMVADRPIEDVSASQGVVVNKRTLTGGVTRIEARGAGGAFELMWRKPSASTTQLESVLIVAGGLRATIDGRSVRTEAKLLVTSYGRKFRSFRVRLPPNSKLEDHSRGGLIASMQLESEGSDSVGDLWRVELTGDTEVASLDLVTDTPLGLSANGEAPIELAGFEVPGAIRQFGKMALLVDDNWQLRWEESAGVQQIADDQLDTDLAQGDVTSAVEYFRQPWSLKVRVVRRDLRVSATPRYRMEVGAEQVRLRMSVDYRISGGKVWPLLFGLNGWQVDSDPVSTVGFANTQWYEVSSDDTLSFPLAEATAPNARVTFWLVRELTAAQVNGDELLRVPLPTVLRRDEMTIAGSELTVVSAKPGIEIAPLASDMPWLVLQPRELTQSTTSDQLRSQQYVYRGLRDEFDFVAELSRRPRELDLSQEITVNATTSTAEVTQDFLYDVRYQSIETLTLELPDSASIGSAVEFSLLPIDAPDSVEGMPLQSTESEVTSDDASDSTATRYQVALGRPQLGEFRLRASFLVALPAATRTVGVPIPLLVSTDAETDRQQVQVVAAPGDTWDLAPTSPEGSDWQVVKSSPAEVNREATTWQRDQSNQSLLLKLSDQPAPTPGSTVVDRLWVQSWLAPERWQQRFVARITSNESVVRFALPVDVLSSQVEVTLDGELVTATSNVAGEIAVPIPPAEELQPYTIELRYRQLSDLPINGPLAFDFPRILGDDSRAESYWQIILPREIVLAQSDGNLMSATRFGWDWFGRRPRPAMSTAALVEWSSARERVTPAADTDIYLYASVQPLSTAVVRVVSRPLLVGGVAGAALAVLLFLAYLPLARRASLFAGGLALLGVLGLAYPMWAALLGHAVLIGCVLATIGWLLLRLVEQTKPQQVPTTSAGSTLAKHTSHESFQSLSLGSAVSSNAPTVSLPASE